MTAVLPDLGYSNSAQETNPGIRHDKHWSVQSKYDRKKQIATDGAVDMNKNSKTLLAALFLVAYLAVLLKSFVFKGLNFNVFFLHFRISSGGMSGILHNNYVPFKTILSYLRGYPGWGVALVNLLGNIIPFMPLGFLLPLLYRPISWKGVLGIGGAYSLCIETLQLGLRVGAFDVDDILLNTLGVMLGYLTFLCLKNRKFAPSPGRPLPRWGTVRLRMTLWNVAVLTLILGALGGVVRYKVQADRFAAVDRTLAERAHEAGRQFSLSPSSPGRNRRTTDQSRLLDPMTAGAEGSQVGSRPRALPPLLPRILPRDRAGREHWDKPWDQHAFVRSLAGRTVYSTVWVRGMPAGRRYPMRILSMPIERGGKIEEVVQLAYPLDGVLRDVDGLTSTLLALTPFGLLAAGLGGAFLTGHALRPVREIAGTAARLGASDLSERLPVSGYDEFSELSSSFNAMLARLEEAFDRQRRFTADASHELRTPLSIIQANTSLGLEHPWPEERYREFLGAIDTAAGRQSHIVEELLFLARADAGRLARDVGPVCLIEALEEAAESVSRPAARGHTPCIRLESIDPALIVPGSGSELTRLFTNLLENAVRHTPPEGMVTVSAMTDAMSVTVTVTDTGEGIAPEHLPHLGERFYRVDASRSAGTGGTGLGLAICRSIIEAHGGRMTIESKVGEGTVVRIRLLLCPPRT
jgi:heavy metal sensor kinase